MPNAELLEEVMTFIEDHPEKHRQDRWITPCGTAACFAGWTWLLSGKTLKEFRQTPRIKAFRDFVIDKLNISHSDAYILFHAHNSRENLRHMVKDLLNGERLEAHWELRDELDGWRRCDA